MSHQTYEEKYAEGLLCSAIEFASVYSEEDDLDAAVVALLVTALEIATNRTINQETMYAT